MDEFDTFGITLSVRDWRALLALAQRVDRAPSDYLRLLIRREATKFVMPSNAHKPNKENEHHAATVEA